MIYFNNAATTLRKPPCVAQAVLEAMQSLGSCGRGAHEQELAAGRTVYRARAAVAELFGCPAPERVVFTANATQALNTALFGLFEPGDHVITTDLEHNSVLRPLYRLEEQGMISLSFVPADPAGRVDYEDFERLIRPETRAIVCTHASNLTGNLLDIARIGAVAKAHGLLLVVDAAQTAGAFEIDMVRDQIDVLCFTGHKSLMGPQGTGGLCGAPGVQIRPLLTGGTGTHSFEHAQPEAYPEHLEAGTLNGHGLAGLLAAVEFIRKNGISNIHAHERGLMLRFLDGVRKIPEITVYGDFSGDRAPIVTLSMLSVTSDELADWLAEDYDIAVRAGAHCAPRMHRALGTAEHGAVRFSFGYYNTEDEVDAALAALREISRA